MAPPLPRPHAPETPLPGLAQYTPSLLVQLISVAAFALPLSLALRLFSLMLSTIRLASPRYHSTADPQHEYFHPYSDVPLESKRLGPRHMASMARPALSPSAMDVGYCRNRVILAQSLSRA
ncbi:hypothetical protein B0H13DRAFT_2343606 [Mycena leptocephala]|nr:hypothetical protein B0H13DRAFT_2343606 [Mycena leptocephala]